MAAEPGSLGVVIGGSGNGEQIAANKVTGVRAALVWTEETAALAPPAQRRQRGRGRRPHAHRRGGDRFVEVFLATPFSEDERHARRIGMLTDYERTGDLPPLPPSARS